MISGGFSCDDPPSTAVALVDGLACHAGLGTHPRAVFRFLRMNRPSPRALAERWVAEGNAASNEGRKEAAAVLYRRAIEADPTWSAPHFNLGLAAKMAGRWQESIAFNRTAVALSPDDEGAWWNLGIAATALADWGEARRAWKACGVDLPPGDGPPDGNMGVVPVRLDPEGLGEVVWSHRIDPARARIINIPLPGSGYRFGDRVLTDGAAVGHRVRDGRKIPVFNVLRRLEISPLRTFVGGVTLPPHGAWGTLAGLAEDAGGAAEDWANSVQAFCKACSEGTVDPGCTHGLSTGSKACAIAARDEAHLQDILDRWHGVVRGVLTESWTPAEDSDYEAW